ncbi:hypothetical protein I6N95_12500 [Vagococcus sp. BWB3-3]|uniref:Uncharacterized protein n=1 Tax=Vagococcus allomyrinae TaxID=2794353 RepID=A0A940SW90_9ENTE|nr:hypothetical protein [Vagococcus allomyrinae]MBP1041831.1 hypothetical protein [Vagococcus allomyrinae]
MEQQAKIFKKAKTWNMVQLVLSAIGTVFSLLTIPTLINPSKSVAMLEKSLELTNDPNLIASMEQSIQLTLSPVYRIYSLATIVLSTVLLVCYILANQKLKQQINVSKIPYYVYLGTVVLSLIISFAQGNFAIGAIAITLIGAIPVILVLVNLFKLDSDEE